MGRDVRPHGRLLSRSSGGLRVKGELVHAVAELLRHVCDRSRLNKVLIGRRVERRAETKIDNGLVISGTLKKNAGCRSNESGVENRKKKKAEKVVEGKERGGNSTTGEKKHRRRRTRSEKPKFSSRSRSTISVWYESRSPQ